MSIETLHNNDYVAYTDSEGNLRYRSPEEQAEINRDAELKGFLEHSSLSDEDMQHLRSLSAEYTVVCAPIPEDKISERREVLDYLISDLPAVDEEEEDFLGLRRLNPSSKGPMVAVDGNPVSVDELERIYMLIEPSVEVLNRATDDAALDHIPVAVSEEAAAVELAEDVVLVAVESSNAVDESVVVSSRHEGHKVHETLRPITDKLKHLGSRALVAAGLR